MQRAIRAIAGITFQETRKQPTTRLITLIAAVLILLLPVVALYALGSEEQQLKEMGFSSIGLATALIALLGAANTVTREIDNRTMLALLAKPVSRGQVVVGKYIGLMMTVLLTGAILGASLMLAVIGVQATTGGKGMPMWREAANAWYDAQHGIDSSGTTATPVEDGDGEPGDEPRPQTRGGSVQRGDPYTDGDQFSRIVWSAGYVCTMEGPGVLFGTYMILWGTAILCALLVAGSTVLPVAANAVLGLVMFTVGNLMDLIDVALRDAPLLQAGARTLIPNLRLFEISEIQAMGLPLPWDLAVHATLVGLAYIVAWLAIGCLLLERRDVG